MLMAVIYGRTSRTGWVARVETWISFVGRGDGLLSDMVGWQMTAAAEHFLALFLSLSLSLFRCAQYKGWHRYAQRLSAFIVEGFNREVRVSRENNALNDSRLAQINELISK